MPERKTLQRAARDKKQGKSPSTQAGEFVREEIDHVREGKHGVKSAKQAVAIGLSKARRAGVDMKPPAKGKTSTATRKKAEKDYEAGHKPASKRAKRPRRFQTPVSESVRLNTRKCLSERSMIMRQVSAKAIVSRKALAMAAAPP